LPQHKKGEFIGLEEKRQDGDFVVELKTGGIEPKGPDGRLDVRMAKGDLPPASAFRATLRRVNGSGVQPPQPDRWMLASSSFDDTVKVGRLPPGVLALIVPGKILRNSLRGIWTSQVPMGGELPRWRGKEWRARHRETREVSDRDRRARTLIGTKGVRSLRRSAPTEEAPRWAWVSWVRFWYVEEVRSTDDGGQGGTASPLERWRSAGRPAPWRWDGAWEAGP